MGKRSNLYEVYFGPDGSEKGRGYGIKDNGPLGSMYTLGGTYGIYDEPDSFDIDEEDEGDVSDAIIAKVNGNRPMVDPGSKANRQSNYTGAYTNLAEKKHTTTVMQGSMPNLTYRGSKGQKLTKTSFSPTTYPKIYNRPRVDMIATQYGTSRSNLPNHDQVTNPVWSLDDMLDNHEYSLHKHQRNINKIKKLMNEIKV